MSDADDKPEERLRQHPRERFAEPERLLDFDEEFDELLAEDHGPVDGHRQIAVAHRRGMTLMLFYFEEGGHMPDHQVDGSVTMHVLDGELEIHTDDNTHHLQTGQMLILEPGVNHDVEAHADTKLLLTVAVEH